MYGFPRARPRRRSTADGTAAWESRESRESLLLPGSQPGSRFGLRDAADVALPGQLALQPAFSSPLQRPAHALRTLGQQWPLGRSRGHMAEGDAGTDQRQVRPRGRRPPGLTRPPYAVLGRLHLEAPPPGALPLPPTPPGPLAVWLAPLRSVVLLLFSAAHSHAGLSWVTAGSACFGCRRRIIST